MYEMNTLYSLEFNKDIPLKPEGQWTDDEISQAILLGIELDSREWEIKELLEKYGASEKEVRNFLKDLTGIKPKKDEAEEENLLIANADKLKATQEGREIIKNAPTMAKDELAKKIKEFLQ